MKIQKLKEEDMKFQRDLEEELEREEVRREEQELGPLKKKDKI